MLTHVEMVTRIVVGAALGASIGYERDRHKRPAGLRTHLLVALASATFMVISSQMVFYQNYEEGGLVEVDSSRIASSVVSAVGFLAGGSILRSGLSVQGLTTAAGLWLVTAIGLGAGAGMYVEAVAATVLGLVALSFLRRFEDKDDRSVLRRVTVVTTDVAELNAFFATLRSEGSSVAAIEYDHTVEPDARCSVTFEVTQPVTVRVEDFVRALEQRRGVRRVHVRQNA